MGVYISSEAWPTVIEVADADIAEAQDLVQRWFINGGQLWLTGSPSVCINIAVTPVVLVHESGQQVPPSSVYLTDKRAFAELTG